MSQVNITVEEFIDMYQDTLGYGKDSQCSYDLINRARMTAYPMGNWVGTIKHIPIAVNGNGMFTAPYDIETIKGARRFDSHITVNSIVAKAEYAACCHEVITRMEQRTYSPFQLTENCPVSFFSINKNDSDKEMRVSYLDHSGSMHDEYIKLAHGLNQSSRLIHIPSQILRIEKPTTIGMVAMVQGSSTGYLHPEDKFPTYTIYCAEGLCNGCIVIEAKKKYIPYTRDDLNQIIDIHPEAIASLIIAIKAKNARDPNWANEHVAAVRLAKEFLDMELHNEKSNNKATEGVTTYDSFADSLIYNQP